MATAGPLRPWDVWSSWRQAVAQPEIILSCQSGAISRRTTCWATLSVGLESTLRHETLPISVLIGFAPVQALFFYFCHKNALFWLWTLKHCLRDVSHFWYLHINWSTDTKQPSITLLTSSMPKSDPGTADSGLWVKPSSTKQEICQLDQKS